jgi:arsenate reductase-like glutaredoxin family protein
MTKPDLVESLNKLKDHAIKVKREVISFDKDLPEDDKLKYVTVSLEIEIEDMIRRIQKSYRKLT